MIHYRSCINLPAKRGVRTGEEATDEAMDDVAALLRLSMLLFCDENGLTLPNACSFSSTNIIGAWRQIASTFGAHGHHNPEKTF